MIATKGDARVTQEPSTEDSSLLGGILVRDAGLSLRDLQGALDHQRDAGGLLGEILVERGLVTESDVREALERQAALRDD